MKRKIFTILALVICSLGILGLTGCTGGDDPGYNPPTLECQHNYTTSTINPTCTTKGYKSHTCSKCYDSYKDNYTDATGHNFVEQDGDYSCSRCSTLQSNGFSFNQANWNGESCYVITNASNSNVINGVLELPRKYQNKNVRGVMSWSFSAVADNIQKIIIHDNIKFIDDYLFNGTSIWNSDLEYKCPVEQIVFDSTCSEIQIEANSFYNCYKLTNVNITKGMIKYIPCEAVISYTGSGNAEYLFKGTPYYQNNKRVVDGLCYIADLLLHAETSEVGQIVTIDSDTVAINSAAFAYMTQIKEVTIPKSVLTLGKKAFYGCSNLETIYYEGTTDEFNKLVIEPSSLSGLKARKVICTNGDVTTYRYNGYTYYIGQ